MRNLFILKIFFFFFISPAFSQVVYIPTTFVKPAPSISTPETGFLPGKAFPFYQTLNIYNFDGLKLRVEILDERFKTKSDFISCSNTPLGNFTEFSEQEFISSFGNYVNTLFTQAKINVDPSSTNKIEISLEAIDCRLIGFGKIVAHGLCEIKVKYKDTTKSYCIDITDSDPHAPISSNSWVTRKTAIRFMGSASIREVLEQFLSDLKNQ